MMTKDPLFKEELYNKISESVIMKYKDPNSIIVDDTVVDTNEDESDEE